MRSITSLIKQLGVDYPNFHFINTGDFSWDPSLSAIGYTITGEVHLLLHELGHACLNHTSYARDVQLLEMERAAWEYAQTHLSSTYGVKITTDQIDTNIDTYRIWLHQRSLCPTCACTGIEKYKNKYHCPACHCVWQPNIAKTCALRRYKYKN